MTDFNAGVVGYPVEHSLSPKIHNAVYGALGIPWRYGLSPARSKEELEEVVALAASRALLAQTPEESMVGFNITMPLKQAAFEVAGRKNVSSFLTGAANTLSLLEECSDGVCSTVLACDSTDGEGACRAIEHSGVAVRGSRFMVLGTGGAATSIAVSAILRGAREVAIVSRDRGHALDVAGNILARMEMAVADGELGNWGFGDDRRAVEWKPRDIEKIAMDYAMAEREARGYDIIVNATPLGMNEDDPSPLSQACLREGQLAMDAVYAHGLTQFRSHALDSGASSIDGLPMLVEQAILSMSIWLDNAGYSFSTFDPKVYAALRSAGIEVPVPNSARQSGDA